MAPLLRTVAFAGGFGKCALRTAAFPDVDSHLVFTRATGLLELDTFCSFWWQLNSHVTSLGAFFLSAKRCMVVPVLVMASTSAFPKLVRWYCISLSASAGVGCPDRSLPSMLTSST